MVEKDRYNRGRGYITDSLTILHSCRSIVHWKLFCLQQVSTYEWDGNIHSLYETFFARPGFGFCFPLRRIPVQLKNSGSSERFGHRVAVDIEVLCTR